MGKSRGSQSRLVVDESVWASEAEGEAAVLAEFADETAVAHTGPRPVAKSDRTERADGGWRLLNPHTPMKEVVRIVLVGCFSAMALGASFAIGFGYIWSDLGVATRPVEIAPSSGAPSTRGPSPPSSPEASSHNAATPANPAPSATPTDVPPLAAEVRQLPIGPAAALPKRANSPGSATVADQAAPDPGPAFGIAVQRAVSNGASASEVGRSPSGSDEKALLVSQPMPPAVIATIPAPVAPASPSLPPAPIPARSTETGESAVSSAHRADLEAVHRAIERYQAAYSQKDVGAMALVWPSVDVAGVARAFENVDKQALTLSDCRITTSGNLATAVCPGQVRYVGRVGGRQLQERDGTWTIALERNGDAWQFTRLNVR